VPPITSFFATFFSGFPDRFCTLLWHFPLLLSPKKHSCPKCFGQVSLPRRLRSYGFEAWRSFMRIFMMGGFFFDRLPVLIFLTSASVSLGGETFVSFVFPLLTSLPLLPFSFFTVSAPTPATFDLTPSFIRSEITPLFRGGKRGGGPPPMPNAEMSVRDPQI